MFTTNRTDEELVADNRFSDDQERRLLAERLAAALDEVARLERELEDRSTKVPPEATCADCGAPISFCRNCDPIWD